MIQKIKAFFAAPRTVRSQAKLISDQQRLIEKLRLDFATAEAEARVWQSESNIWGAAYDAEARIVKQMRQLVSDAIVTLNTLPSMPRTTKTDRAELVRVIKRIAEVYDESSDTPNS